jgi:hypothetical protein
MYDNIVALGHVLQSMERDVVVVGTRKDFKRVQQTAHNTTTYQKVNL